MKSNLRDLNIYLSTLSQSIIKDGDFAYSVVPCIQNDILNYINKEKNKNSQRSLIEIIKTHISMLALVLISILSVVLCIIKRPKFGIYSVDIIKGRYFSDPRITGVYEYLKSQHRDANFIEFVHSVVARDTFYKILKRRRPVIYLEAIDYIASIFIKSSYIKIIDPDLRDLELRLFTIRLRIKILSFVFSIIGVKTILMIDDFRIFQSFVIASKLSRLKSVAFQHGRFSQYIEHLRYEGIDLKKCATPDKTIAWNGFWRNALFDLYPVYDLNKESVVVGGSPRSSRDFFSDIDFKQNQDNTRVSTLSLLFVYEPHSLVYAREVIDRIKMSPEMTVLLKLRPDIDKSKQIADLGLSDSDKFKILSDWKEIIEQADLVVGTYSTFLYECVGFGLPVIGINCPKLEIDDLVSYGVAIKLDADQINYKYLSSSIEELRSRVSNSKSLFKYDKLNYSIMDSIL